MFIWIPPFCTFPIRRTDYVFNKNFEEDPYIEKRWQVILRLPSFLLFYNIAKQIPISIDTNITRPVSNETSSALTISHFPFPLSPLDTFVHFV